AGSSNFFGNLPVTNGLFTVTLDAGTGAFTGDARWLQIAVRPGASTNTFVDVVPRHPIATVPYAIYAGGVTAGGISGTLPSGALSGVYGGAVAFTNGGNSFSGNGGGLTNLNASNLTGTLPASALYNASWLTNSGQTNLVVIAVRTDNRDGIGTPADPRNGTPANLDALLGFTRYAGNYDSNGVPSQGNASPGTVYYFKAGSYTFTNGVLMKNNMAIIGENRDSVHFYWQTNANAVLSGNSIRQDFIWADEVYGCTNPTVENISIHLQAHLSGFTNIIDAIELRCIGGTIRNVDVFDPQGNFAAGTEGFPVDIGDPLDIATNYYLFRGGHLIENVRIFATNADYPRDYISGIGLFGNPELTNHFGQSRPSRIVGCGYVGRSHTNGLAAFNFHGDTTLENCYAVKVGCGVRVEANSVFGPMRVFNNAFEEVGYGIALIANSGVATNFWAQGNHIKTRGPAGILIEPAGGLWTNVIFKDNVIDFAPGGSTAHGFYLAAMVGADVSGNRVHPALTNRVFASATTNVTYFNNRDFNGAVLPTLPDSTFDFTAVRISGGSPAPGKVWTATDASGAGAWVSLPASATAAVASPDVSPLNVQDAAAITQLREQMKAKDVEIQKLRQRIEALERQSDRTPRTQPDSLPNRAK
ncbi:MAG TPA: hypothetical protein VI454_15905, partial [Verrucomicrobiae bacterium]